MSSRGALLFEPCDTSKHSSHSSLLGGIDDFKLEKLLKEGEDEQEETLDVIAENFLPDVVLHRKTQLEKLASVCRSACRGQVTHNIFCFGLPGTGKTLCVKYVFATMNRICPRVSPVYVNLRGATGEYSAACLIATALKIKIKQGYTLETVYSDIFRKLNKKRYIIALDEIDSAKDTNWLLYRLLRQSHKISFILISNSPSFFEDLDMRTRSSLGCVSTVFPAYTEHEIFDILHNKTKNSVLDEVLKKISSLAEKKGDLRLAFQLFLACKTTAERFGVDIAHIPDDLVNYAYYSLVREPRWELLESFGYVGMFLFACIIKAAEFSLTSNNVLNLYNYYVENKAIQTEPLTDEIFNDIITKMIKLKLVRKVKKYFRRVEFKRGGLYDCLIPFSNDKDFRGWLFHKIFVEERTFLQMLVTNIGTDSFLRMPR